MLNFLWAFMILSGIFFASFTGKLADVTNGVLDSSKEAITLCITMVGIMSFWSGLMEIASEAGILRGASRRLRPVLHFLFPDLPANHPALIHISTNFVANFLGLGWAATPAGLKAMEALQQLENDRRNHKISGPVRPLGTASNEMCTFLILNISSLQLIPLNVIAYRSQYGSVNPTAITGAGIAATVISTLTAVIYCKLQQSTKKA